MHNLLLLALISVVSFSNAQAETISSEKNAYQFNFTSIDGAPMPLSDCRGQVIVAVNTASQCGFTGQYTDLQQIYEEYKEQGLVVIGMPCNQFARQEPDSEQTIAKFVSDEYGVTFPLTSKVNVKGSNIHPFFEWVTGDHKGEVKSSKPNWNFHKFIIDRNGQLAASFGSRVKPTSKKMRSEIERLLNEKTTPSP
ncbi:MAG: glutathione peroxidase [Pseudomonadota bacterium]